MSNLNNSKEMKKICEKEGCTNTEGKDYYRLEEEQVQGWGRRAYLFM